MVVGPWCTDFLVGHDPRSSDPNAPKVPAMTAYADASIFSRIRLADADCAARTSGPYRRQPRLPSAVRGPARAAPPRHRTARLTVCGAASPYHPAN